MLSVLSVCSQHLGRRGPQVASCLHRPAASMTAQRLRYVHMLQGSDRERGDRGHVTFSSVCPLLLLLSRADA